MDENVPSCVVGDYACNSMQFGPACIFLNAHGQFLSPCSGVAETIKLKLRHAKCVVVVPWHSFKDCSTGWFT